MKKLNVVVLVLLLVSIVTYGQGHWENNPSYPETWTSGDVGVGTDDPQGELHVSSETSGDAVVIIEADEKVSEVGFMFFLDGSDELFWCDAILASA